MKHNKYKLHILDRLVNYKDEVLYLDFDATPTTNESFFDVWDLNKGIAILHNTNPDNRQALAKLTFDQYHLICI
mgnify:CR=1 FL=1